MSIVPFRVKTCKEMFKFQVNSRADNPGIFKVIWKENTTCTARHHGDRFY